MSVAASLELEQPSRAAPKARSDALFLLALTGFGAALSLVATGTAPFVDNNVFHLPILGRLYDLPQYAHDPFMQSLRFFASGFWQALAGSDRLIDPGVLILAISAGYRALMIAGFLSCARALGVTERPQQVAFVVMLVSCDLLQGLSFAGGGGMFTNQASHSEIANGLLLLSWGAAARGRIAAAIAWTGAIFFCNAFMGVWNMAPIALMIAVQIWRDPADWRHVVRQCVIGSALFAAFAAPVVANVLANPDFGTRPDFDYLAFLTEYWPKHFLFDAVPTGERLGLGFVAALALLAFAALGARSTPFLAAFAGFALVYAIGVAVPELTSSPTIINLHLLRSSVGLQMLSALAAFSLAALWLTDRESRRERMFGASLVVTLCVLPRSALLGVIALIVERLTRRPNASFVARDPGIVERLIGVGLAIALAVSFTSGALDFADKNGKLERAANEWTEIGAWAKANTDPFAVFLTPTIEIGKPVDEDGKALTTAVLTAAGFEYASQRRVYVDVKRGAAAMWSPSYHALWRSRRDDVLALASLAERRRYAGAHGVDYVIDLCAGGQGAEPLFRTRRLCVYAGAAKPELRGSLP